MAEGYWRMIPIRFEWMLLHPLRSGRCRARPAPRAFRVREGLFQSDCGPTPFSASWGSETPSSFEDLPDGRVRGFS